MKLRLGSDVTGAPPANEIKPLAAPAAPAGNAAGAPEDTIRISSEFETLALMQATQPAKVAQVAAAIQNGIYQVDSTIVSKSIVENALSQ